MDQMEVVSVSTCANDINTHDESVFEVLSSNIYEDISSGTSIDLTQESIENLTSPISPESLTFAKHEENDDEICTQEAQKLEVIGQIYELFIGNLTWWTTDENIIDAIAELGVKDCIAVAFFENRRNGMSKGHCVISLRTESSARTVLEKLPSKELYGRKPIVTCPSKQALAMLESQWQMRELHENITNRESFPLFPSYRIPPPPSAVYSARPQFFNRPEYTPMIRPHLSFEHIANTHPYSRRGFAMHADARASLILNQPSIPGTVSPGQVSPNDYRMARVSESVELSNDARVQALYDNLMYNNQQISSTAISKAVSESASGDYTSAMDTLQTALTLVQQSQTVEDERCQTIIRSLQRALFNVRAEGETSERRALRRERIHESPQWRGRRIAREERRQRHYSRDFVEDRVRTRDEELRGTEELHRTRSSFHQNSSRRYDEVQERRYWRERTIRRYHR
ncbi:cleavage and polyadenylation specificity factor subunit 6-like [Ctenocephalides felis]|uniref:cleavage and polyadenylation specificity factor subunit 6-like n=1 Tax=Ctenocephalides felis TaxID=7515 RepID=UPI000E6E42A7|nr:cleavage and polyadenylation specificity factor subunit 6-like [Ctenocephalides felis]